jgi:hypothetical protein
MDIRPGRFYRWGKPHPETGNVPDPDYAHLVKIVRHLGPPPSLERAMRETEAHLERQAQEREAGKMLIERARRGARWPERSGRPRRRRRSS